MADTQDNDMNLIQRKEAMYTAPTTRSANLYAQHGKITAAATATPHELISLLFDAIDEQLVSAAGCMEGVDAIERRGKHVNKAVMLIQDGLRAALDLQNGGELAQRLDALYEYCATRLAEAHAKRDRAMFEEVRQHLRTVADGWKAIRPQ
ncbi:flagellar export chaperone FliS [Tepidimonas taiwanensis]|uniref:flagellar export chaperone FliS n=1 Tax=Tepidimonas taiwanensis TaxID=307486 RepID=UPI0009E6DAC2|nr:flagellar export chaperone FliS [Tepidimonas taiwanensis]